MKRICCFCERWESGGIESFLNNVLSRLDMQQVEVDIVAADLQESIFTKGLREKGISFYELSGRQQDLVKNWKMFRELLAARHYDVVHINAFQGLSLYYARLAKQAGVPVRIAHSHNTALRQSRTRWLKMILHNLGRKHFSSDATDWWACSTEAARFLFSKSVVEAEQYRFIPNGIETQRFCFDSETRKRIRTELGVGNSLLIGNVGRLCYQKNQEFLLDVFRQVLDEEPSAHLLLVGSGDQEEMLRQRAKSFGILDRVIFYGVTDQIQTLFWAMDVFAFPSRFEGLGIVAVEAQASGLPVVCSEQVPMQANVTDLFQSVGLDQGATVWAQRLRNMVRPVCREGYAKAVADAGFHVDAVSRGIQKEYLR